MPIKAVLFAITILASSLLALFFSALDSVTESFHWLQLTTHAFLSFILTAKLIEMSAHVYFVIKQSRFIRNVFRYSLSDLRAFERKIGEEYRLNFSEPAWVIMDLFSATAKLNPRGFEFVLRIFWSYAYLMLTMAISAGMTHDKLIARTGTVLLIMGIAVELLYMIHWTPVDRIRSRRHELELRIKATLPEFILIPNRQPEGRDQDIDSFFRAWFFVIPVIIISYGSIYSYLQLQSEGLAFDGVLPQISSASQDQNTIRNNASPAINHKREFAGLIYFSIVTFATVGYGDITPSKSLTLPRIFVSLEIITGLLVLVAIIARVSANISIWPTNNTDEINSDIHR